MSKIDDLLEEIESKTLHAEITKESISKASIGWHLDHSLKVINSVITALQKSDLNYKPSFNWKKSFLFLIKKIPRGKAKAPKAVRSFEEVSVSDIARQLQTARTLVSEMKAMHKNAYFAHPYIGQLHLKQAVVFLEIHTRHHLKIIDDILKK